jgi:hypothetical protein
MAVTLCGALLLPAGAASAQAQAMRFDLDCRGTEPVLAGSGAWKQSPFSERLHVDLNQSIFCSDACPYLRRIALITRDEFVLVSEAEGGRHVNIVTVERTHEDKPAAFHSQFPGQNVRRKGSCKRAPFSGFPSGVKIERLAVDPWPYRKEARDWPQPGSR